MHQHALEFISKYSAYLSMYHAKLYFHNLNSLDHFDYRQETKLKCVISNSNSIEYINV